MSKNKKQQIRIHTKKSINLQFIFQFQFNFEIYRKHAMLLQFLLTNHIASFIKIGLVRQTSFIIFFVIIYMEKALNCSNPIFRQEINTTLANSPIKFNLSEKNLACFKGEQVNSKHRSQSKASEDLNTPISLFQLHKSLEVRRERSKSLINTQAFNEQVVFMNYDDLEMYVDNSTHKKSKSKQRDSSKDFERRNNSPCYQNDIISSCVMVITEQTDNTSNDLSKSQNFTAPNMQLASQQYKYYEYLGYNQQAYYQPKNKGTRNKRSITNQESKAYTINYNNIESDGRTTVMIKNIPNKYTQDMLHDEISVNHKGKFNFFYLPIDKNSQNNFGFAFVNFINTADIRDFYEEFHNRKWKQYKSPKICQLYYARYQGTQELTEHFRYTKIIQKDKKVRPIFGNDANDIKEIKDIITSQLENKKFKQMGNN